MKRFAVVIVMLLVSCATQPQTPPYITEFSAWSIAERDKALRGEALWSSFYLEAYSRLGALPPGIGKADTMDYYNRLIPAARDYEAGKITKEQFFDVRRFMQVEQQKKAAARQEMQADANREAARQILMMRAMTPAPVFQPLPMPPAVRSPTQTNCQRLGNEVNCTTY